MGRAGLTARAPPLPPPRRPRRRSSSRALGRVGPWRLRGGKRGRGEQTVAQTGCEATVLLASTRGSLAPSGRSKSHRHRLVWREGFQQEGGSPAPSKMRYGSPVRESVDADVSYQKGGSPLRSSGRQSSPQGINLRNLIQVLQGPRHDRAARENALSVIRLLRSRPYQGSRYSQPSPVHSNAGEGAGDYAGKRSARPHP